MTRHAAGTVLPPRCGRPMARYEGPAASADDPYYPVCGKQAGHKPPCRSEAAVARNNAASVARRFRGSAADGEALREAREQVGLSQRALARLLGVPQRRLWGYEHGEQRTLPVSLAGLIRLLAIAADTPAGERRRAA